MFNLAQILTLFNTAEDPNSIANLQIPIFLEEPLLQPITWEAIARLCRVIEDTRIVQRSVSRSVRALALNRALGELKAVLDNANTLPKAERELIVNIGRTWREALLSIAIEVGEITIARPVRNPYVIGNPVKGRGIDDGNT